MKTKPERKDYSSSYCEIQENSIEIKTYFYWWSFLCCHARSYRPLLSFATFLLRYLRTLLTATRILSSVKQLKCFNDNANWPIQWRDISISYINYITFLQIVTIFVVLLTYLLFCKMFFRPFFPRMLNHRLQIVESFDGNSSSGFISCTSATIGR